MPFPEEIMFCLVNCVTNNSRDPRVLHLVRMDGCKNIRGTYQYLGFVKKLIFPRDRAYLHIFNYVIEVIVLDYTFEYMKSNIFV